MMLIARSVWLPVTYNSSHVIIRLIYPMAGKKIDSRNEN